MAGQCIFVFFIIFNTIFGLAGLASLGIGIYGMVREGVKSRAGPIALLVVGSYITLVFILGSCSWKKDGVLIAYFVLILLVVITDTTLAILIKYHDYFRELIGRNVTTEKVFDMAAIVLGVSAGVAFLSFLFSTIYFCLYRRNKDNQLYSVVRNLEYTNLHQV